MRKQSSSVKLTYTCKGLTGSHYNLIIYFQSTPEKQPHRLTVKEAYNDLY